GLLRADGDRDHQGQRRPCRDPHPRQRHRHPPRGEGEDVQPLLHDQAGRRRHRARAVDEPRHHRETAWRHDRGRHRTRRVHGVPPRAATGQRLRQDSRQLMASAMPDEADQQRIIDELKRELYARTAELAAAREQQTATADVLRVISGSAFDLQSVFKTIVQTASRLCEAEFALIYELHGERYEIVAANNAAEAFVRHAADNPLRPGRGSLIGRTALERKPVHIPDCLADPEYSRLDYQAAGQYRTMLGVPLLREGQPIGIIGMQRTTVRPFTEKQIELVTTFADQAVIAIENARLFEEVQAR